jgi:integrase
MAGKLTTAKIRSLGPGRHGDGNGLWLQVSATGARSWVLRYWVNGRERVYGLGPLRLISLAEARQRAWKVQHARFVNGTDPIEQRKKAKADRKKAQVEAEGVRTFGQVADAFIKAKSKKWSNKKHADQWAQLPKQCALIWDLPVADIDTPLLLRLLRPLWDKTPVTGMRVRGRIEQILGAAKVEGFRTGDNPAQWRGLLEHALLSPSEAAKVVHHAALGIDEAPKLMAELRARDGIAARALEFLTLTATRSGEVLGATWDEIDLAAKVWTIPAARMKAGKEHRVPLSPRAMAILASQPRLIGNDFVFPGIKRTVHAGSMLALMRELRPDLTVHGLRSTFRDWAGDKTNFQREVIEHALAHGITNEVEASYRRSDALEKRRRLMDAWAAYCGGKPAGNVIEMKVAQ